MADADLLPTTSAAAVPAAPAKPASAKFPKFARLSFTPAVQQIAGGNVGFYHCDHTGAVLRKAAFIPVPVKNTTPVVFQRLGAFMDFHCAVAYAYEAQQRGEITAEQFDLVQEAVRAYLGASDRLEVPSIASKELQTLSGQLSITDFCKGYTKRRVAAEKYRTPESDANEKELKVAQKQVQAGKVAQDSSKLPLQVFAGTKNVAGAKSLQELLTTAVNEEAADKLHAFTVATIPELGKHYVVKRVFLSKDKDADMFEAISAGLEKTPKQAPLPEGKQARTAHLVCGRGFKPLASSTNSSTPNSSPATPRKRKNSDAAATAESEAAPKAPVAPASGPAKEKSPAAKASKKHPAQSPSPSPKPKKPRTPSPASDSEASASPKRKPLSEEQKLARRKKAAEKKAAAAPAKQD